MAVSLVDVPAAQRPRERLVALGPQALTDVELLALLLRHGRRGASALDLAVELLVEHGGLAGLAAARPEELSRRAGVGVAKASAIIAAFHLGARARGGGDPSIRLTTPADVASAARPLFAGARVERLLVLVCDAQNRLRRKVFVAEGAVDQVAVPVREIMNTVLRHDGRAFAVVHNHPSGDPTPSVDDRRATTFLADAAHTVGLRFLDHVVIAGEEWASASGLAGGDG
ncbi:DNA repair protein RadC [Nocardia sp. NPDC023852]|uniref:JAB domain-containing protein n=1 Tax=Nocardia sp. NPDC023852 TaxID=3154697 RepID=UPI0033E5FEDB